MKKFLAATLLLIPLAVSASSDYGMNVPKWEDFAPKAFVNVDEPKGLGKLNVTAKYWYERRLAFYDSLAECREMEAHEERFSCYEALKSKQYRENSDYNARIEAKEYNMSSDLQGMGNMTNTMIPVNNYVNSFTQFMPNELRGY